MVSLLSKAYEKITHLDGTPVTTTGGTYAKINASYCSFWSKFYRVKKGIGHQPNEWMKIEDLNTNAKIYALGIYYFRNVIGESMKRTNRNMLWKL